MTSLAVPNNIIYLRYAGYKLRVWAWQLLDDGAAIAMVAARDWPGLVMAPEGCEGIEDGEVETIIRPVYVNRRSNPTVEVPDPDHPSKTVAIPEKWLWEIARKYDDPHVLSYRMWESDHKRDQIRAVFKYLHYLGLCSDVVEKRTTSWLVSKEVVYAHIAQITGNAPPPLPVMSPIQ